MARPRPLIAGNWKMNGVKASLAEANAVRDALRKGAGADVMICPPATLIAALATAAAGSPLIVGAQDCHANRSGAHTGDLSADMLKDAGATAIIVGHSERRTDHGETDAIVRAKAIATQRAGLTAIICLGETAEQRRDGQTIAVVERQLAGSLPEDAPPALTVIAYEPVWAIGTGLTPTPADVAEVHAALRARLLARLGTAGTGVRILYGGSVKPSNAGELLRLDNVDGALVGGASLKAADFLGIIGAVAA